MELTAEQAFANIKLVVENWSGKFQDHVVLQQSLEVIQKAIAPNNDNPTK